MSNNGETTAVDYIENQRTLERQARELMPYDPKECSYVQGGVRQIVYACITCSKANDKEVGVCYSCSIQCHLTHDIVELFSKRNFTCDCGTTRMAKGGRGCRLRLLSSAESDQQQRPRTGSSSTHSRSNSLSGVPDIPAEDIPSLSNIYNHNYKGLFCSCERQYNPLEDTATMYQCYFGDICGEDWFHEDCILGYKPGFIVSQKKKKSALQKQSGKNLLDLLPLPGEDAISDKKLELKLKHESPEDISDNHENEDDDEDEDISDLIGSYFPKSDTFDQFICWRCIEKHPEVFEELVKNDKVVFKKLPHFENVESLEDFDALYKGYLGQGSEEEPQKKKAKTDSKVLYSVFLSNGFREHVPELLKSSSVLNKFFSGFEYLYKDDPVHQPAPDDGPNSSYSSLLDLGTEALLNMPREQAIEGLHAYDKIRSKLRDFFKPFAEQGKVVTEEEVRDFFKDIKEKND